MALEAPIKIDFGQHSVMTTEKDISYTDPERSADLQLHAVIGILLVLPIPQYDESGKFIGPVAKLDSLTHQVMDQYLMIRGLIGGCVANAEAIVTKLIYPNIDIYKQSVTYQEGENAYEIVKLFDFMKLKNSFVDYIKNNFRYNHLEAYGKSAGKAFRRELNYFVLYRNIFTHGMLRVMMPDYTYCIEYIDNITKKKAYMLVTPNLINAFNETFIKFNKLLDDFRKTNISV